MLQAGRSERKSNVRPREFAVLVQRLAHEQRTVVFHANVSRLLRGARYGRFNCRISRYDFLQERKS